MNYEYTEDNRLDSPHKYMYTPYQGSDFLDAYFRDRSKYLKRFEQVKKIEGYQNKIDLSLHSKVAIDLNGFFDRKFSNKVYESLKLLIDLDGRVELDSQLSHKTNTMALSSFDISGNINSENLLRSLLDAQLDKGNESLIKFWLDLLVQRFEVTKKLYESYPANFRKGEGRDNIIRLYWLFALSLTLFYRDTKNIKYLNSLLKVTDLLCSLSEKLLNKNIPIQSLSLIILVEMLSVKSISKTIEEAGFEFT
jgi:hypothetical protein